MITVTRTGDTSGTNSVNFATSNGTATGGAACTAGVDYISVNQMVTFNPTITSQTVNVTMCADSLTEFPNQTVNLTLTGANLGIAECGGADDQRHGHAVPEYRVRSRSGTGTGT